MTGYDYNSIVLTFAIIILMLMVMAIWWNMERGNDRAAIGCAVATIATFFFFVWAQHQAERKAEIEHAAEHRAVQESVKSIREF